MDPTTTRSSLKRYGLIVAALLAALSGAQAGAQEFCGNGTDGLQVDYNDPADIVLLRNINTNHFNANVQNLVRGQTSAAMEADLDYVLRNSPNHHKGLNVMAELHMRLRSEKIEGESYSMPCWFERAMRFAPTDFVVPMIYGIYLHRKGDLAGAEGQYQRSIQMSPAFAEAHYNLGLLYVARKQFDKALTSAREAYRLGYPLPGLKEKLIKAGVWEAASNGTSALGAPSTSTNRPTPDPR
jgi:tetratricopeptide (TPR) repeat protein